MTHFNDWCTLGTPVPIGGHQAAVLESYDDAKGSATLAAILPNAYAESNSLAIIAERFGKAAVAKFLRNKLPTKVNARSGDMGEILATAYLHEGKYSVNLWDLDSHSVAELRKRPTAPRDDRIFTHEEWGYVVGPSRLIQRDHQEWAMRGDDSLGAKLDSKGRLRIIKAEAKSRATLRSRTIEEARQGLARNDELPSPHSLTQFAERLLPTADSQIGEAVLTMQLSDGVRPDRVGHLMFLFTGSDPSAHVTADLEAYSGPVPQLTVTLRVKGHKKFIKDAYDGVTTSGS